VLEPPVILPVTFIVTVEKVAPIACVDVPEPPRIFPIMVPPPVVVPVIVNAVLAVAVTFV
jgi:hypothetical protein